MGIFDRPWAMLLATAATLAACGAAQAAVILDPIPSKILPGARAGLIPFVTAPPTGGRLERASIQSIRALKDGTKRMFITDTRGLISVTTSAGAPPQGWFDLRSAGAGLTQLNSQTGLLSIAFHPNFNGKPGQPGYGVFYTIYTTAKTAGTADYAGNGPVSHHDVVREWTVNDPTAPTAQIASSRELLRVAQPLGDHGAGTISFNTSAKPGDADYGKLYIGLGDGGGVSDPYDNAQDMKSPFGKILRIDPVDPDGTGPLKYGVPGDNPFAGKAGTLGEIWASGLRNPQQFSWDDATGTMYIAEIGQAQLEEVDIGRAGANYGWPAREGTFGRSATKSVLTVTDDPLTGGFVDPIAQYDHDEGSAIGGAILYRGSALPALFGQMVVSDIVNGRLFHFDQADTSGVGGLPTLHELLLSLDGTPTTLLALEGPNRVDLRLGLDAVGEIYLLTKRDGDIYRLGAVPEPATWAMLILGFGAAGAVLRRRRRGAGLTMA